MLRHRFLNESPVLAKIVHTHIEIFALGRARLGVLCGEKDLVSVDSLQRQLDPDCLLHIFHLILAQASSSVE
jgi:hypothetical protein